MYIQVPISFNGPQLYTQRAFGGDLQSHVLARLVHRGFIDSSIVPWDSFIDVAENVDWRVFRISVFFEAIVTFFKKLAPTNKTDPVVFFAVDEVATCGSKSGDILDFFKRFLSGYPNQCRLLVTTLDELMLQDGDHSANPRQKTPSNRPIHYLVFTPIVQTDKEQKEFITQQLSDNRSVYNLSSQEIGHLVTLGGGHPRSLGLLKDTIVSEPQIMTFK